MIRAIKGGPIPKGLIPRCEPGGEVIEIHNPDIVFVDISCLRLGLDNAKGVQNEQHSQLELHS